MIAWPRGQLAVSPELGGDPLYLLVGERGSGMVVGRKEDIALLLMMILLWRHIFLLALRDDIL